MMDNNNIKRDIKKGINLSVEYEIEVTDNDGNIIEHRHERSESLVKNFLMLLYACFKIGTATVVDTSGSSQAGAAKCCGDTWSNGYCITSWHNSFSCGPAGWTPTAPEADDTYGIIVGTSDQPVSVDDYNLISKIAHGDSAGQLYHYATTMLEPTVDGNTVRQRFERTFKNNSGADITVKEIGLVVKTSEDNYLVMIIRDVLSTPVTVSTGGKMRVIYRIVTGG